MDGLDRLRAPVVMLAMAGVLLQMLPAPAEGAVNPVPFLELRLDSASQDARVTESAPGIVQFTGRASIDKLPVERCIVTLASSTDTGWASQISPGKVVFLNTTPQPFTCSVIVPPGTPNSQFGNLIIRGHASAEGYQATAWTRGIIAVDPYFRLNLSTNEPYREISPGQQAFFTVWLNNTGNAVDSFELVISNLRDLAAKEWTVIGPCPIPKVLPGESKPFRITVQSPRHQTIWTSEPTPIIVMASSQNARDFQQVVTAKFQLMVYVRGAYLPDLDLSLIALYLSFGIAIPAFYSRRHMKRRHC